MGIETERKFLIKAASFQQLIRGLQPEQIRQGYLCRDPERTVRVRLKAQQGYLTIKGKSSGFSRPEFEYPIPAAEAEAMLKLCEGPLIEKNRYKLYVNDQLWEIDEFFGDNAGLLMAEAELEDEQQALEIPEWIEKEVSEDVRYYNSNLAVFPFKQW